MRWFFGLISLLLIFVQIASAENACVLSDPLAASNLRPSASALQSWVDPDQIEACFMSFNYSVSEMEEALKFRFPTPDKPNSSTDFGGRFKNENPKFIHALKDLLRSTKLTPAQLSSCESVLCVATNIWGKESGLRILYLKAIYGINASNLGTSPSLEKIKPFSEEELNMILFNAQNLPARFFPIHSNSNYTIDRANREYIVKGALGKTIYGSETTNHLNYINIYNQPNSPGRTSLSHEIGHNVFDERGPSFRADWDQMSGWTTKGNTWSHNKGAKFVSIYAGDLNNLHADDEDFAESFEAYRFHPDELKSCCSVKYDFLKKRVFVGEEFSHEKCPGMSDDRKRELEKTLLNPYHFLAEKPIDEAIFEHCAQKDYGDVDCLREALKNNNYYTVDKSIQYMPPEQLIQKAETQGIHLTDFQARSLLRESSFEYLSTLQMDHALSPYSDRFLPAVQKESDQNLSDTKKALQEHRQEFRSNIEIYLTRQLAQNNGDWLTTLIESPDASMIVGASLPSGNKKHSTENGADKLEQAKPVAIATLVTLDSEFKPELEIIRKTLSQGLRNQLKLKDASLKGTDCNDYAGAEGPADSSADFIKSCNQLISKFGIHLPIDFDRDVEPVVQKIFLKPATESLQPSFWWKDTLQNGDGQEAQQEQISYDDAEPSDRDTPPSAGTPSPH